MEKHDTAHAPQEDASISNDQNSRNDRDRNDDRDRDRDEAVPGVPGDGKAEEAAAFVDDILDIIDLDVDVEIREDGERVILDVDGPDVGRIIGKKGQTIDAFQFLINKIVNRFPDGRRHVVLDSGDYRERHDDSLVAMAKREAERALRDGRIISLQPMNARDRRVIHLSLADENDVSTSSSGEGLGRRVQIIPASRSRGGRRRRR